MPRDDDQVSVRSASSVTSSIASHGSSSDAASISSSSMLSAGSGQARSIISSASPSSGSGSMLSLGSGMNVLSDSGSEKIQTKFLKQLDHASLRRNMVIVIASGSFNNFMLSVIVMNTVVLALQTSDSLEQPFGIPPSPLRPIESGYTCIGWYFGALDSAFLAIYLIEAVAKIYAYRSVYFRSGWNLFDFVIVVSSLIIFFFEMLINLFIRVNTQIFRLLRLVRAVRAIRSLRVLRTINFMKSLQIILGSLLKSLPALGTIMFLQGIVIYMFAVIARSLYSDIDPRRFGSLGAAAFRMFQIITLENWGDIYTENRERAPTIWIFLWTYIILANFILANLFVAVICSNLRNAQSSLHKLRKKKRAKAAKQAEQEQNEMEEAWNKSRDQEVARATEIADKFFKGKEAIDNFYPQHLSGRQRELYSNYYMLLASLENGVYAHEMQQKMLDDLVDLLKQNGDEGKYNATCLTPLSASPTVPKERGVRHN